VTLRCLKMVGSQEHPLVPMNCSAGHERVFP
jgi:hypothetical protein